MDTKISRGKRLVIGAFAAFVLILLVSVHTPNALRSNFSQNEYSVESIGEPSTFFHKLYFQRNTPSRRISPWHDIKLVPQGHSKDVFNFVCEIPQGTRAKMEINKEHAYNPIIQDVKHNKLRDYPFDSLVNYGAFPQTWEDPDQKDHLTGLSGDNDPLDVLDISEHKATIGEIYPVKVLGALGMIDGGEMDWKIITVALDSSILSHGDNIHDLLKVTHIAQQLNAIQTWFRDYKIPDGKPANKFSVADKSTQSPWYSKEDALSIVASQHEYWKKLVHSKPTENDKLWWQEQPHAS